MAFVKWDDAMRECAQTAFIADVAMEQTRSGRDDLKFGMAAT
jgi:hypothetical protein